MGIQGLAAFLHEYFRDCYQNVQVAGPPPAAPRFDYLYVDANSLLYGSNKGNLPSFFRRLQGELDRLLRWSGPPKVVYLALDGPAPLGKIFEQRKRRLSRQQAAAADPLNPVQFTPGTELMTQLQQMCRLALGSTYRNTKFFLSGADREGEGEFKIFEHIARLPTPPEGGPREKVAVVGNDSDLLVFALSAPADRDIYVVQEKSMGQPALQYDIKALREEIIKLQGRPHDPIGSVETFIIATFMRGNDYLPKLGTVDIRAVSQHLSSAVPQDSKLPYHVRMVEGMRDLSRFAEQWRRRAQDVEFEIGRVAKDTQSKDIRDLFVDVFAKLHKCPDTDINSHLVYIPNPVEGKMVEAILYVKDEPVANARGVTPREAEMLAALTGLEAASAKLTEEERSLVSKFAALKRVFNTPPSWLPDKPLHIVHDPNADKDLNAGARYLRAIHWIGEYYAGRCLDYQFYFPSAGGVGLNSVTSIENVALDLSAAKNNMPLMPVSCSLALVPPKFRSFVPAAFQLLYDSPDLPLLSTDAKAWSDVKAVANSLDAAVEKLAASLTFQQRKSHLWFHPSLLIQRVYASPCGLCNYYHRAAPTGEIRPQRVMECIASDPTSTPEEPRGPYQIGEPITGLEFLECMAENRADWRMDSVASYNIPYTDDTGAWKRGLYQREKRGQPSSSSSLYSRSFIDQTKPSYAQQKPPTIASRPHAPNRPPPMTRSYSCSSRARVSIRTPKF